MQANYRARAGGKEAIGLYYSLPSTCIHHYGSTKLTRNTGDP